MYSDVKTSSLTKKVNMAKAIRNNRLTATQKIFFLIKKVGAAGLELATSASQTLRSSHLSYAPL